MLETNGVPKIDVKEVIKKQLENASKRKGGKKTQKKSANDEGRINTTNVDYNLELYRGNNCLRLNIRSS